MDMTTFLGIDLGTSGVRVVILDENQTLVASEQTSLKMSHPKPLLSEQDPKDWWQAVNTCMHALKASRADALKSVKAIGLSGQMHGATLLDKQQNVLRPAILWNDGRSMLECQELVNREKNAINITGNLIMPGFTAPKLLWVKKHEPDIFKKIDKVLLPKDYIRLKLSGDYATDLSDASGTSWLNVRERKWSSEMLAACDLTESQMATCFEGNEITGQILESLAKEWGLPSECKIVAGAGDNAASAISINVVQPGTAFLSLGTSGVYFVSDNDYHVNVQKAVHSFCHCLPRYWHQMAVHLSAASCLSWAAKVFDADVETLMEDAERLDQPSSVVFLPYLSGERTPYNDTYARGVFFGLNHNTTRAELTQAILEGIAMLFAEGQQAMLDTDISINEVSVLGGGAHSYYWGKILASALQRPLIYRKARTVGAAVGAARLAWLAINEQDPVTAFHAPDIEAIIDPEPRLTEHFEHQKLLFGDLYTALRSEFRKL